MALLHLHDPGLHQRVGACRIAARAFRRLGKFFRVLHRAIVRAKLRRLRNELMWRGGDTAGQCCEHDATRLPQAPMILGDKWDF
jgi:hypothetical protein